MNTASTIAGLLALTLFMKPCIVVAQTADDLGVFTDQGDIGTVSHQGSASFDAANGVYKVTGGGANMWFTNDAFHFVWVEVSGDGSFTANVAWPSTNGAPHRKACLMIRQTLDPDSAYADAALHGNGLTSLQYRENKGDTTREIESNVNGPAQIGIEKHGAYVSMLVGSANGPLHPAGGSFRIQFKDPFYIGLAVCSHDDKTTATAEFSQVKISAAEPVAPLPGNGLSALEVAPIGSKDRRVIYCTSDHLEAPNWSRDGTYFIFNRNGRLCKLPVAGGQPEEIDTGFAVKCNNDHGLSPDGTQLAISDQSQGGKSLIYVLPVRGGAPRRITPTGPSYWHGWSPDGKTLAFCGERNGEFDVYTVPAQGGPETRLTTSPGLDDGPDYSPDGKFIYFNSVRSGLMQIWRMKPDGSDQEQVTSDDYNNWFAHPSPDGKWLVFLSYEKGVTGHPGGQDVMLRLMPVAGGKIEVLAKLFGGQGTMNVPSWSPDSKEVAFVSYQPLYPK